jgi:hypothetical protein
MLASLVDIVLGTGGLDQVLQPCQVVAFAQNQELPGKARQLVSQQAPAWPGARVVQVRTEEDVAAVGESRRTKRRAAEIRRIQVTSKRLLRNYPTKACGTTARRRRQD